MANTCAITRMSLLTSATPLTTTNDVNDRSVPFLQHRSQFSAAQPISEGTVRSLYIPKEEGPKESSIVLCCIHSRTFLHGWRAARFKPNLFLDALFHRNRLHSAESSFQLMIETFNAAIQGQQTTDLSYSFWKNQTKLMIGPTEQADQVEVRASDFVNNVSRRFSKHFENTLNSIFYFI